MVCWLSYVNEFFKQTLLAIAWVVYVVVSLVFLNFFPLPFLVLDVLVFCLIGFLIVVNLLQASQCRLLEACDLLGVHGEGCNKNDSSKSDV